MDERQARARRVRHHVGKARGGVYFYLLNVNYDDGTAKKYSKASSW